jgi:uncharacterized protein YhfF
VPLPESFLAECRRFLPPGTPAEGLVTRRLGRTPELCERLNGYILARQKTGVFSAPEDFEGGRLPRAGEFAVLVNFDDEPRCLIRYDECTVLPLGAVGPEHVAVETAALRDVTAWRRFHRGYWEPVFAARGQALTDEEPIVFQRFTVLYPPPPPPPP